MVRLVFVNPDSCFIIPNSMYSFINLYFLEGKFMLKNQREEVKHYDE